MNIFREHILLVPIFALMITTLLKSIYVGTLKDFFLLIMKWKISSAISKMLESWWMPSVHSSFVSSLATSVALKEWINSDLFAITLVISLIIIYDAVNVRWEAWLHAKELNKILNNKWESKLSETIWHLPKEAFVWTVLWIWIAYFLMMY